jgi:hypothetical protein
MEHNFITLGFNCVPALILKDMGLRKYSLPFDWNYTNKRMIIQCIEDDFRKFHKKLKLVLNNHWLEDEYGIQYPHDYPVNEDGSIVDNWETLHNDVLLKYQRRINRFKDIMNNNAPIIALYHGYVSLAKVIKAYLANKYNKQNIIFIVCTYEKRYQNNDKNIIILNVDTMEQARNKNYWENSIRFAIKQTQTNIAPSPVPKMNMKFF